MRASVSQWLFLFSLSSLFTIILSFFSPEREGKIDCERISHRKKFLSFFPGDSSINKIEGRTNEKAILSLLPKHLEKISKHSFFFLWSSKRWWVWRGRERRNKVYEHKRRGGRKKSISSKGKKLNIVIGSWMELMMSDKSSPKSTATNIYHSHIFLPLSLSSSLTSILFPIPQSSFYLQTHIRSSHQIS